MPGSTQHCGLCPGEDFSGPLKVARQWLVDGSSPAKATDTRTERINECVELEPRERANTQWLAPSLSHSEGPASPDVSAHLLLGLWLLGDSGARTRDVLLQKSCLGSSVPPTRPKVTLENLPLFCGRVSMFASPSSQHAPLSRVRNTAREGTLSLLQVVQSWTSFLPKDLKAESEVQHPYPVKVSKSGWHTACPCTP